MLWWHPALARILDRLSLLLCLLDAWAALSASLRMVANRRPWCVDVAWGEGSRGINYIDSYVGAVKVKSFSSPLMNFWKSSRHSPLHVK